MKRRLNGLVDREAAPANEKTERSEQRPEKTLSSVSKRMALIRFSRTFQDAEQQKQNDSNFGNVHRSLGSKRGRSRNPRGNSQASHLYAVHHQ
jgi:hypothetical protein